MVQMKNPIWGTGKVVIMDRRFYILEGLIFMVEKGVFGSVLIQKRRYCTKGVPEVYIIWNIQQMEVGDLYTFPYTIHGKRYYIMTLKEPNHIMLMMTTYRTLENLEGSDTQYR